MQRATVIWLSAHSQLGWRVSQSCLSILFLLGEPGRALREVEEYEPLSG